MSHLPIGLFDSGIGGLSIALQIRHLLPAENLVYIADSLHAPYGDKPEAFVTQRAAQIVDHLLGYQVKAVVVACNTATVSAVKSLREQFEIPIIGVEPGVKPAVENSVTGVVGVLATTRTLQSESFNHLASRFTEHVQVEVQPCPGLVEQIEALGFETEETRLLLQQYVEPLLRKGADHIVLGCTHYAFIAPLLESIVGPEVKIVTTDDAVARETQRRLQQANLVSNAAGPATYQFLSSGNTARAVQQFSHIWGEPVGVTELLG